MLTVRSHRSANVFRRSPRRCPYLDGHPILSRAKSLLELTRPQVSLADSLHPRPSPTLWASRKNIASRPPDGGGDGGNLLVGDSSNVQQDAVVFDSREDGGLVQAQAAGQVGGLDLARGQANQDRRQLVHRQRPAAAITHAGGDVDGQVTDCGQDARITRGRDALATRPVAWF